MSFLLEALSGGFGAEGVITPSTAPASVPAPSMIPAVIGASAETGFGLFLLSRALPGAGWFFIGDAALGIMAKFYKRSLR